MYFKFKLVLIIILSLSYSYCFMRSNCCFASNFNIASVATNNDKVEYKARISTLFFQSQEQLGENVNNDYQFFASHFDLKIFNLTSVKHNEKNSFHIDIKEKYDIYGKLNRQYKNMEKENELEIKTLELYSDSYQFNNFLKWRIGRYSIDNVNGEINNGLDTSFRISSQFSNNLWAGYYEKNEIQGGFYLTYLPDNEWQLKDQISTSNGFFFREYTGKENYLTQARIHHQLNFSKNNISFFSTANYDWQPITTLSYLSCRGNWQMTDRVSYDLGVDRYDAFEYEKNRDSREIIVISDYQSLSTRISYKKDSFWKLKYDFKIGNRRLDNLFERSHQVFYEMNNLLMRNLSFSINSAVGQKYLMNYKAVEFVVNRFNDFFELFSSIKYQDEKYFNGGNLHPLWTTLGLSIYINRNFFLSSEFQRVHDSETTIISSFVKLTYRFGTIGYGQFYDGVSR